VRFSEVGSSQRTVAAATKWRGGHVNVSVGEVDDSVPATRQVGKIKKVEQSSSKKLEAASAPTLKEEKMPAMAAGPAAAAGGMRKESKGSELLAEFPELPGQAFCVSAVCMVPFWGW
jgi:hypothetical protein